MVARAVVFEDAPMTSNATSLSASPAAAAQKFCTGCERTLPVTAFHFKVRATGSRQSRCVECAAVASRRHYEANAAEVKAKVRIRNTAVRARLAALVAQRRADAVCADCGVAHAERAVQFTAAPGQRRVVDVVGAALSVQALTEALDAAVPLCHRCVSARHFSALRADCADLEAGPTQDMLVVDAVVAAVISAPAPVTLAEIAAALTAAGRDDSLKVLRTTLARAHAAGRVARVSRGRYWAP